jgi:hypothetical protein
VRPCGACARGFSVHIAGQIRQPASYPA